MFQKSDMRCFLFLAMLLFVAHLLAAVSASARPGLQVLEGTVFDSDTREPIGFATVRIEGTGKSTLANEQGDYRVLLSPGERRLKFSHVAHYSHIVELTQTDSVISLDVYLSPSVVEIGGMTVHQRAFDPGQLIIIEAIRRKEYILSRIHDYSYDAYAKLIVSDETDSDSTRIFLLTETQTTAYWEHPDKYKEIITTRRQSANLEAENNLVTVGEILDFNRNRIDIGRHLIVSPTAEDALDHYNYYLLDTLYIDSQAVFRLEIEPKDPEEPLFQGYIHVADSTYDVVKVDIGFSRGVDLPFLIEPRYSQRFALFESEYWMPVEIRFAGNVEFDIPLPGLPRKLGFAHIASLHSYRFDVGIPRGTFDEYLIEVEETADDFDSARWFAHQTIPLTTEEKQAYQRIDSLENLPSSIGKRLLMFTGKGIGLLLSGEQFFRFNRVEGTYLGFGATLRTVIKNTEIRFGSGYAFAAKRSEHQIGFSCVLHQERKLTIGADYCRRIVPRPTIVSNPDYNPTLPALAYKSDPFDYYWLRGSHLFVSGRLVNHTRLALTFNDYYHRSMLVNTGHSWFEKKPLRGNPAIVEGRLRSLGAEFHYDSRKLLRLKGRDERIGAIQFTQLTLGMETAAPEFIDNDFDYLRYYVQLFRRQRSADLGLTSIHLYAGASQRELPPQCYYSVDFGDGFFFNRRGFNTLDETNFGGNRALAFYVYHNFRHLLFRRSGIPLLKNIPFRLSVYGGAFQAEFHDNDRRPGNEYINTTNSAYRELGFGLSNLTPFMSPFNFALYFTWQLSDYDTNDFSLHIGLEL